MRGLKFLLKSWTGMPAFVWITVIMSVGGAVLPFVFHEEFGSDDYLMPKLFLFFPALLCTEIGVICGCRSISANKLVRSMPIAKELYSRAVPLFVVIFTVGVSAVMIAAYFIFLGIIGAESCEFADTLICGAIICFLMLAFSAPVARIPGGGVLVVYAVFVPFALMLVIGGDKLQSQGFGVSLGAAVIIFIAAIAAGSAFAFWISAVRYKKSNYKVYNTMMTDK